MTASSATATFGAIISLCLQGRCSEALPLARKLNKSNFTHKQRRTVDQFIKRFSGGISRAKISDQPIDQIIAVYERYWHEALLLSGSCTSRENHLRRGIRSWLKEFRELELKTSSLEKLTARLKQEIEAMGYFCITGIVSPLQELEIWKKQKTLTYTVRLPESLQRVKTYMMSDFLTRGWVAYATAGLHSPGGWAEKSGLFCNAHAYNLKSEKFRVSYLGHEAQHYSDFRRFPSLQQTDVEYRAKLTEFALARKTTKKLYELFAGRADYNRESPHAFANFCAVRDIAIEITGNGDFKSLLKNPGLFQSRKINVAANRLLHKNSEALEAKGAKKVRQLIS